MVTHKQNKMTAQALRLIGLTLFFTVWLPSLNSFAATFYVSDTTLEANLRCPEAKHQIRQAVAIDIFHAITVRRSLSRPQSDGTRIDLQPVKFRIAKNRQPEAAIGTGVDHVSVVSRLKVESDLPLSSAVVLPCRRNVEGGRQAAGLLRSFLTDA